eukprot:gb/GECG01003023.1/.p1 GENE.gb/GECG01003023.1/~~gb/GECG01003023.1/.p1  ORF type:complete len:567 (+),score=45.18 gb/GECG01003023.1/:1-1701(+)
MSRCLDLRVSAYAQSRLKRVDWPWHPLKMTVSVERFLAFTDAYLAIIATLMVTALVHLKDKSIETIQNAENVEHKLREELSHRYLGVVVYFITFHVIARHFLMHAKAMTSIPRVKLGTIAAHIFGYFPAIAFLPSTTSFLATYFDRNAYIGFAFFGNLILLSVASGIVDYTLIKDSDCRLLVFSRSIMHVGHPDVLEKVDQKGYAMRYSTSVWYTVYRICGDTISLSISMAITVAVGVGSSPGEWYLYPIYAVLALLHKFVDRVVISKCFPPIAQVGATVQSRSLLGEAQRERTRKHKASLFDKSRLEAFADGVFGIVSTLIVLEIKPNSVSGEDSEALGAYLHEHRGEIISAVVALLLTASLWNIHATMVSLLEKSGDDVTHWTFRVNGVVFSWVGLIPFSISLVTDFPKLALPPLILGIVFLFITMAFTVFLILVTRKFTKSKQAERDSLVNNVDSSSAHHDDDTSDPDVLHFRNIANQAKVKLVLFGLEAFALITLGLVRLHNGPAHHDFVITSIMLGLLFCLSLEMFLETRPYFKEYVDDDLDHLRGSQAEQELKEYGSFDS